MYNYLAFSQLTIWRNQILNQLFTGNLNVSVTVIFKYLTTDMSKTHIVKLKIRQTWTADLQVIQSDEEFIEKIHLLLDWIFWKGYY